MIIETTYSNLFACILVSAVSLTATHAGATEQVTAAHTLKSMSSPSFTAVYQYLHEPSLTELDSARVSVSDVGLRIDQLTSGSGNVLIANFDSDRLWFMDSQRELVHEVPVQATELDSNEGEEAVSGLIPGFIQFHPCEGMRAVYIGNIQKKGHDLTRWQCYSATDEPVHEQLFLTRLGVVVWSQDMNGYIGELIDIRVHELNPDIFRPPSHYREVEIGELFNNSTEIETYRERESDHQ